MLVFNGRTTRHAGYAVSRRIRKKIEEAFGWMKMIGGQAKTKLRGAGRSVTPGAWIAR